MARAKQTARKSTGGRAPRKLLARVPVNFGADVPAEPSLRLQPYPTPHGVSRSKAVTHTTADLLPVKIPIKKSLAKKTQVADHNPEVIEIYDSDDLVKLPIAASIPSTGRPMVRTRQTARKSTGGKAPRNLVPAPRPSPDPPSIPEPPATVTELAAHNSPGDMPPPVGQVAGHVTQGCSAAVRSSFPSSAPPIPRPRPRQTARKSSGRIIPRKQGT